LRPMACAMLAATYGGGWQILSNVRHPFSSATRCRGNASVMTASRI
jgi:hypothetical protein